MESKSEAKKNWFAQDQEKATLLLTLNKSLLQIHETRTWETKEGQTWETELNRNCYTMLESAQNLEQGHYT